ncbi:hypothetical protein LCGC14_0686810 [marine sediment metagenome]|uniref:Uncharacterized protein n=1 Tax=marine sediment metagenome TaxID=412755 RepID=A0A0F9T7U8_9ZZZZ
MLTKEQSHRLLEDLESLSLALALAKQITDQFKRDMEGMIGFNVKDEEGGNG